MKKRTASLLILLICFSFSGTSIEANVLPDLISSFESTGLCLPGESGSRQEKISESWMGLYMNGIKVGYSCNLEFSLRRNGKEYRKDVDEIKMRVSRLGGNPVELVTIQESVCDEDDRPLECILRIKMSDRETILKAEVVSDKILFQSGDKIIKELPVEKEFFLSTPLMKIIKSRGLKPGEKHSFNLLDMTSSSIVNCTFEVLGREDVLILGEKMTLWHIREEIDSIIPITNEEWIGDDGRIWKSISQTRLANWTSIRMNRKKALQVSERGFDIAFSTVIKSNVIIENPQEVQRMTFKLRGLTPEKIRTFPFDDESQKILKIEEDYALVQTVSQIFHEEEAAHLPLEDEELRMFLKPTLYCQSDDPEIQRISSQILGGERNAWKAAKKIAEWLSHELVSNYDIGFASAKEVLERREGDCTEYTVLMVALSRAAGIPARAAVGVMYGQGLFAYHMWPEVYVGRWISLDAKWLAVDKKNGQFYTDATHIKFGQSILDENIFKEMAQAIAEVVGQIKLEVVNYDQDR